MKTGMVLGKLMPPHAGHLYLVGCAKRQVEKLYVVVEHIAGEPIPSSTRFAWMKELAPDCEILHLDRAMPQAPDAHPRFWDEWRETLLGLLPERPEAVFASEAYGHRLAAELGARFVPVDPAREAFPVSGTEVRSNPFGCWRYLPPPVRAHYAARICLFGPESTGKSTAARALAQRFATVHVPEHAATMIAAGATRSGTTALTLDDLEAFARGQRAAEATLARSANRVLFCDSDALTTVVWAEHLFGACPAWIREEARARRYAHTLLFDVDLPWKDDVHRYAPKARAAFLARCREALEAHGRSYTLIRGRGLERTEACVRAVVEATGLAPESSSS